jgi:hypothetical protein
VTAEQRDTLCLALAVLAEALPLAYLALTWKRTSRLASYGRCMAWWLAVCSPFVMGVGYFDAAWPYGDDGLPFRPQFRWGSLAFDLGVGYFIVCGLGVLTGYLMTLVGRDPREPERT